MQETVTIPVMPESEYMKLLKEAHKIEIIESRLTDRREDLYSRLTSFWCEVGNLLLILWIVCQTDLMMS